MPSLTLALDRAASIGSDIKPKYPVSPAPEETFCETATASVCTTTLSYGIVDKRANEWATPTPTPRIPFIELQELNKQAVTTTFTTLSFCIKVTGCGASDITKTTEIETIATNNPRVVIPVDPQNVGGIRALLQKEFTGSSKDLFESRTDQLGTIFFFVPALTDDQTATISEDRDVLEAYIPKGMLTRAYWGTYRDPTVDKPTYTKDDDWLGESLNVTVNEMRERSILSRRSEIVQSDVLDQMVLLSWPPMGLVVPAVGQYRCVFCPAETIGFLHEEVENREEVVVNARVLAKPWLTKILTGTIRQQARALMCTTSTLVPCQHTQS